MHYKTNDYIYLLFYTLICAMLVFKPPFIYSNLNAIFTLISSAILATIFISRKNKIKNIIITLFIIFFFIHQLIFYKISASFAIIVSTLALLYMSAKTNPAAKKVASKNFYSAVYWISVISVLFSFPFLFESHLNNGSFLNRYSTFNGDPNYTALVTITPLLLAINTTSNSIKRSICILLIIFILIISASRTALLAVIIFFINYQIKDTLYSKALVIVTLLVSISSQYTVLVIPELLTYLDSESSIRLFNMNDRSNEIRLESYNLALTTIKDNFNYFFINGTKDYHSWAPNAQNIPHNWFIQSVLGYGFLLTFILTIIIAHSIFKLASTRSQIVPFITFLLFYAGILSIYPLQVPLTLVIFYFLSTEYRSN